jgi:hypothetical protein
MKILLVSITLFISICISKEKYSRHDVYLVGSLILFSSFCGLLLEQLQVLNYKQLQGIILIVTMIPIIYYLFKFSFPTSKLQKSTMAPELQEKDKQ